MTHPFSSSGAGARISATVKWYNPAKACGFLVPEDGSPDIYCRDSALAAVGLDTLLAGATVDCETVQGHRGPEVSRILAVDFSTASPRTESFARAPGNGRIAPEPGIGQAGAADAGPGRRTAALVKWFMPMKGYGFLEPEDGSPDVFCHLSAVEASGRDTLLQGTVKHALLTPHNQVRSMGYGADRHRTRAPISNRPPSVAHLYGYWRAVSGRWNSPYRPMSAR